MNHTALTLLLCTFLAFPCLAQDSPPIFGDPESAIFPRFQYMGPEAGLTQVRVSSRSAQCGVGCTRDFGVKVPSGVYLYKLEASGFVATRKLILMK